MGQPVLPVRAPQVHPTEVACPTCLAAPDELCNSGTGPRPREWAHRERMLTVLPIEHHD